MKLLFKQRVFSWLDSYDVYDENGNKVYEVKGQIAWGHCQKIFDNNGKELGKIQEQKNCNNSNLYSIYRRKENRTN